MQLRCADDRVLSFERYGLKGGIPVLYFHGIPGSGIERSLEDQWLKENKFDFIAFDRPGIGDSSPDSNKSFQSVADDVVTLLKVLSISKINLVGYSAGGAYALCFAASYPEYVDKVILLSPAAQLYLPEIFSDLSESAQLMFKTAVQYPEALVEQFSGLVKDVNTFKSIVASSSSAEDQAYFIDEHFSENLDRYLLNSVKQGVGEMVKEFGLILSPWDFNPESIKAHCTIWHGAKDQNTPLTGSKLLAEKIPANRTCFLKDKGHHFSYYQWKEVMGTLLE